MSAAPAVIPLELVALDDRFLTATTDVDLAGGPAHLVRPRSAEDLISETEFDRDERLPYWAEVWPSSIALARALPELVPPGTRMLELGCGIGLVSLAAARCGISVLATDYYVDALLFTRRNVRANCGVDPDTRLVDWRAWPHDIGRFDRVVASDVLYERPYAALVADALAASLTDRGVAFIADPGRTALPAFIESCMARGLQVSSRMRVPHHDGAIAQVITIHQVSRSAP
ncbi:MAG: methyltransferase domain-containing protein [Gemmatimonadota bacterium]|nr:methyltransferase domain-containing protein [Gemmatimonadota bacterium]